MSTGIVKPASKLFVILCLVGGCSTAAKDHTFVSMEPVVTVATTTTIPVTTTVPRTTTTQRVSRSQQGQNRQVAAPTGGDFWQRLASCESPTNAWHRYKGYFQFSDANVAKYGMQPSWSYEQQKAAAQDLAAHSDPFHQWPVCWRRALAG